MKSVPDQLLLSRSNLFSTMQVHQFQLPIHDVKPCAPSCCVHFRCVCIFVLYSGCLCPSIVFLSLAFAMEMAKRERLFRGRLSRGGGWKLSRFSTISRSVYRWEITRKRERESDLCSIPILIVREGRKSWQEGREGKEIGQEVREEERELHYCIRIEHRLDASRSRVAVASCRVRAPRSYPSRQ